MSKHLTLSDRAIIEKYLAQDMPFSYIAKRLQRSPSTISREVKNHRCFVNGYRYSDTLSDESVHLITEHINSVTRELFENQTPFDLISQKDEYKKLLDTLGLQPIPLNEVFLKPALLKRK